MKDCETIGAIIDDTACAVLVLGHAPGALEIEWLYVAPAFRGRGVGGALLELAISEGVRVGAELVSAVYEHSRGEKNLLDILFLSRRFSIRSSRLTHYCLSQEEFFGFSVPGLEKMSGGERLPGNFMSLASVPPLYIKQRCRKHGVSSEALFRGADMELSSAYVEGGALAGFLTVSAASPKNFNLENISLDAKGGGAAAGLLRQSAQSLQSRLRQTGIENGEISWYSVNGFAQKLAMLLAERAETSVSYMHTAELEL